MSQLLSPNSSIEILGVDDGGGVMSIDPGDDAAGDGCRLRILHGGR